VNYVDAGYSAALAVLFVYSLGLVLRRRRWARALEHADVEEAATTRTPGGSS
jgi:hypothetical protein